MKIIDLFFYTSYTFLVKLGRSKDQAKWSAMLHISMISLLLTVLSGLILFPNSIIHHLVKKYISWFVLQMFFFVVYYIRYYKTDSFDKIESYYLSLPKDKNRRINIVYGLANVLILFSFFLFAFINKGRF